MLENVIQVKSKRNFWTFTGIFKGKPISISCPGMGVPNTDFLVREARHVIPGPMVMLRFGTCGVVDEKVVPGDIMVPFSTVLIQQNYDFDASTEAPEKQFYISKPSICFKGLHEAVSKKFSTAISKDSVHNDGIMATALTFYSGQGKNCH